MDAGGDVIDAGNDVVDGSNGDATDDGDAHGDGDAGTVKDASNPDAYGGCPQDHGTMVRIDLPDASYCIDTHEVATKDFVAAESLGRSPSLPPECTPDAGWDLYGTPSDPDAPLTGHAFCHAANYCAVIGKRLCGKIGGGRGDPSALGTGEWYYACSNAGTTTFPYAGKYDPSKCATELSGPEHSGTHVDCHGVNPPFSLIFDMVGNVAEHDLTFDPNDDSRVIVRGGTFKDTDAATCGSTDNPSIGVSARESWPNWDIGFRCCADPK
jgi:formylglycine-generating enzyme required for sulfatase activity